MNLWHQLKYWSICPANRFCNNLEPSTVLFARRHFGNKSKRSGSDWEDSTVNTDTQCAIASVKREKFEQFFRKRCARGTILRNLGLERSANSAVPSPGNICWAAFPRLGGEKFWVGTFMADRFAVQIAHKQKIQYATSRIHRILLYHSMSLHWLWRMAGATVRRTHFVCIADDWVLTGATAAVDHHKALNMGLHTLDALVDPTMQIFSLYITSACHPHVRAGQPSIWGCTSDVSTEVWVGVVCM